MATELAHAYLTLIPSLKGAEKSIQSELGGIDVEGAGKKMGGSILKTLGGGFAKVGKIGIASLGAITGAVGGMAISGGISRALKLDQAQYKFKNMGIDTEKAMQSCNEAVSGTAFGLDAAATVAASLGTSGVKAGNEMTQALKATAGMAAMGGTSMERVGLVFGKVAAQGRLQGDELMQLSEMGVNATAALAKSLGKSQTEVREMVSAGEIDFKKFSDAMYASFGEAAQGANDTFQGAMSNVTAALSRIGAKFATPALEGLRKVFVALIPAINAISTALDPAVTAFTNFIGTVSTNAVSAITKFTSTLEGGGSVIDAFAAAMSGMFKFPGNGMLASISVSIRNLITNLRNGISPVQAFKSCFQNIGNTISGGFQKAIDAVNAKIATLPQPIQDAANALKSLFSSISGGGAAAIAGFAAIMLNFKAPLTTVSTALVGFGTKVGGLFSTISSYGGIAAMMSTKINTLGSAITLCGGKVGFAKSLFAGLKPAIMGILSPVNLVVVGIAALVAAFAYMMASNEGFRTSVMAVVASIGSSLVPIVTTLATTLGNLAATVLPVITNAANMLAPVLANIVMVVLQIVAALAPVISQLVGALVPVLGQIITVIANIASAVLPLVAGAIQFVSSAIQAIIPVISAILSVVVSVVSAVISCIGSIISVIGNIIAVIAGAVATVGNFLFGILSTVVTVFATIIGTVVSVISGVVSTVSSGFSAAYNFISSVANTIGSCINGLFITISGIFNNIVTTISNAVSTAFNAARTAFNGIRTAVSSAISSALSTIGEMPGNIQSFFSNAGTWLTDAGSNIIQGLWNGIDNAGKWLWDKIAGLGDAIVEAAKAALGIKSPSRRFAEEVGKFIPSGVGTGIDKYASSAVKSVYNMNDALVDAADGSLVPYDDIRGNVAVSSGSYGAATESGTVYNVYFNNNKVNDDEEIKILFDKLMRTMARKGAM